MQRKIILVSVLAASFLIVSGCTQQKVEAVAFNNPNRVIMPYHLAPASANTTATDVNVKPTLLPIKNQHLYYPGCYIACYSHDKLHSAYSVSKGIYAVGAIRVAGHYQAGICQPVGFVHKNINKSKKFKNLCSSTFSGCKGNKCWAGGDTVGLMNRS